MRAAILCLGGLTACFSCSVQAGSLTYFNWTANGGGFGASQGAITAVVDYQTGGDDLLFKNVLTMTDPQFVSSYGATVPTLKMDSGVGGSAGSSNSFISFTSPLPNGARLFIFDVDIELRSERVFLSSRQNYSLLEQRESQAGATSGFPSWTSASGLLAATSDDANNEEASVFDVSGVSAMTVGYRRNAGGAGVTGASFAFAIPVPEPGGMSILLGACLTNLAGLRRLAARRDERVREARKATTLPNLIRMLQRPRTRLRAS
jgi:hypothetical protein